MSEKSKSTAFLLCYFLGIFGAHRFYVNKVLTGLLMLVTLGGLGIWWLVDSVLVAAGQFKDKEGLLLRIGPRDPHDPAAGFWVRAAATCVDTVVLTLAVTVVLFFASFAAGLALPYLDLDLSIFASENQGADLTPEQLAVTLSIAGGFFLVELLILILYFGIQHGSRHQATVGKRCFHIRLETGNGGQVGYGRAAWRALCYLFSAIPLYLGYVLAAFTRDKRALHDYMAGTRVRYVVAETALDTQSAISSDSPTLPNPAAVAAGPPVAATAATVEKGGGSGIAWMAAGALLLAGAAAVALL